MDLEVLTSPVHGRHGKDGIGAERNPHVGQTSRTRPTRYFSSSIRPKREGAVPNNRQRLADLRKNQTSPAKQSVDPS
jgi:hypothetical protein